MFLQGDHGTELAEANKTLAEVAGSLLEGVNASTSAYSSKNPTPRQSVTEESTPAVPSVPAPVAAAAATAAGVAAAPTRAELQAALAEIKAKITAFEKLFEQF